MQIVVVTFSRQFCDFLATTSQINLDALLGTICKNAKGLLLTTEPNPVNIPQWLVASLESLPTPVLA